MGVDCGSQAILCDMPIRFDTYKGCSHACAYCFVKRNKDISKIEADNCVKGLINFIKGQRTQVTSWCDWNIPLHWGGMSDPFQPCERKYKISLRCLEVFAETQYPVTISTKGRLICDPEYLSVLKRCNAAVQVSMACEAYDVLEKGCPPFEERLSMVKTLSKNCRRVIIRVQPYMLEIFKDVMNNIPRFAEAGAYGLTIEGMKFIKSKKGLVKVGADYCYPESLLKHDYEAIKQQCHKFGMKFYCAENRLRSMGDSMTCCGVDGLGWRVNEFHTVRLMNGENVKPTENMCKVGTGYCFKSIDQTTSGHQRCKNNSFAALMIDELSKQIKKVKQ